MQESPAEKINKQFEILMDWKNDFLIKEKPNEQDPGVKLVNTEIKQVSTEAGACGDRAHGWFPRWL